MATIAAKKSQGRVNTLDFKRTPGSTSKKNIVSCRPPCKTKTAKGQEIRWRRQASFEAYQVLLVTWRDSNFHTDFDIYSSLDDAIADTKAWTFCNADDTGIGFPRDCGPSAAVGGQWTSLTRGGQANFAYYIAQEEKATWDWTALWRKGTMGNYELSEASFNSGFRRARMGIAQRICRGCSASHKEVYFRWKGDLDNFHAYNILLVTWQDNNLHIRTSTSTAAWRTR
eukprot:TRINITY_DN4275_c0_g1_i11.p2 TRINITY_DN4275_c0_g1~~TRINITY_DN4275_c0_g1_i11.p2  ORF type:complete len:227 (+),score=30.52 TRINITY_DN4275_c0_g1_i11:34-714(+)